MAKFDHVMVSVSLGGGKTVEKIALYRGVELDTGQHVTVIVDYQSSDAQIDEAIDNLGKAVKHFLKTGSVIP